ncbi:WhiB family transcriptional regulator [Brevibacterium picturae]|uniref:Transcriptional regulator WhiB n=1 Tax=Brevibacterium picturae TaxID=260553 RepID=A0ABN2C5E5_9MICO
MSAEAFQDDYEHLEEVGLETVPADADPTDKGHSRDKIAAQLSAMGLTLEQIQATYVFWDAQDMLAEPVSCRYDPDTWFSIVGDEQQYAKRFCASCPVINECRDYADALNVRVGIWGGENRASRNYLIERQLMTTEPNTDKPTTTTPAPAPKAETEIWGAPQYTIEEMSKLSPQKIDKAHKAGQLQALVDGDNEKLLEVRGGSPAPQTTEDPEADPADKPADDQELIEWHREMKERYGVEQLTLAEMEELAQENVEELRLRIDEGQTQAVVAGKTGPSTGAGKTTEPKE